MPLLLRFLGIRANGRPCTTHSTATTPPKLTNASSPPTQFLPFAFNLVLCPTQAYAAVSKTDFHDIRRVKLRLLSPAQHDLSITPAPLLPGVEGAPLKRV